MSEENKPCELPKDSIEAIKSMLAEISQGHWEWSRHNKPDGNPIESVDDVVEVLESSSRKGTGKYLHGVISKENGEDITVCYTGNGPRSPMNARFLASAPDTIRYLLKCVDEKDKELLSLQLSLSKMRKAFIDSKIWRLKSFNPELGRNRNYCWECGVDDSETEDKIEHAKGCLVSEALQSLPATEEADLLLRLEEAATQFSDKLADYSSWNIDPQIGIAFKKFKDAIAAQDQEIKRLKDKYEPS